ncbi:MAG: AAA family ATPase [Candidatus Dojkabacteria bacterium]|nr:MAG: AAA family ATPase [Candidatus Dojkabacteria bacterium]
MYISKIKLHNFKGFTGDHEISFDKGINFFVGDNNCGKSSVFEAIEFIRTKKNRDEVITKTADTGDYVSVEIELKGDDLEELLEADELKKYRSALIEKDGEKILQIKRSSEIDIGKVYFFTDKGYTNLTGADKTIGALFDAQFIWADTDSGEITDFSKTKICGKIINTIIGKTVAESWQRFEESHKQTFEEIANNLKPIEDQIQNKLSDQYGETQVEFNFTLPEITDFLKSGNIVLSDSGIPTTSAEKGTGMQRALALAIIQIYADISSQNEEGISKPIIFFIDEPETFLHPRAQNKLLDALEKIAENSQIFVITHSPYLLKKYKKATHSMNVFAKEKGFNKTSSSIEFDLFGVSSPTWGEINYYAFGVLSVEFHNELYGFIQARAILQDEKYYQPKDFDDYLVSENDQILKNRRYKHLRADNSIMEYDTTLPTKIRNIIHHPENTNNSFSETDLKDSIELLIPLLR